MKKIKLLSWVLIALGIVVIIISTYYQRRYDGHYVKSILPKSGYNYNPNKKQFKFAAIGDFNIRNHSFEKDLQVIKDNDVDFVISTGDIGHKARSISSYNGLVERLNRILSDIPFFPTPGNHDRDKKIPIDDGMKAYKTVFGNPDYWFSYGETLFISLNSSREEITDESLHFLESTLINQRSKFKSLVIFSHVPPIDLRGKDQKMLPKEDAIKVHSILSQYEPTLYLSGHQHCFSKGSFNGIPLIVLPASGQESRSDDHGNGFLIISMDNNQLINAEMVTMQKNTSYSSEYWLSTKLNLTYFPIMFSVVLLLSGTFMLSINKHI